MKKLNRFLKISFNIFKRSSFYRLMRVSVRFEPSFSQKSDEHVAKLGLEADQPQLIFRLFRNRNCRKIKHRSMGTKLTSRRRLTAWFEQPYWSIKKIKNLTFKLNVNFTKLAEYFIDIFTFYLYVSEARPKTICSFTLNI